MIQSNRYQMQHHDSRNGLIFLNVSSGPLRGQVLASCTVNSHYSGHRSDLELVSTLARIRNLFIKSLKFIFARDSTAVRSGVSARRALTVFIPRKKSLTRYMKIMPREQFTPSPFEYCNKSR